MLFNGKYRLSNTWVSLCSFNDERHVSDVDERHPGVN